MPIKWVSYWGYENDPRKWSTALLRERPRSKGDETNEPHEFLLHTLTTTVTKEQPTQKSKLDILPRGKRAKPSNELAWLKISGPIFCSLAPWIFLLIIAILFKKADRRDRALCGLCVTSGHPRWIECQICLGRGDAIIFDARPLGTKKKNKMAARTVSARPWLSYEKQGDCGQSKQADPP